MKLAVYLISVSSTLFTECSNEKFDRPHAASQKIVRFDLSERNDEELDEAFKKVRQCREPMIVDLTWSNVGGDLLRNLHGLANLRALYLFGTAVSDRELQHLGELPNLETIDLGGCEITAAGILQLRPSRDLKHLFLANTRPGIGDEAFKDIASAWPDLESLSLEGGRITNHGFAHVRNLRDLRYLNVSRTQISDKGLESLARLSRLTTLHASHTQITDQGMDHVGQVASLEKLDLNFTGITDQGLARLDMLTNLKRIYFVGSKVTDAGLEYLKPLKTIEFVGPSENISPEALKQLKESLPRLKNNEAG